jgi:hypothetical protein
MEDLSDLGGRGHSGAARPTPRPSLPSSSKVSVQVYTVPSSASGGGAGAQVVAPATLHESGGSGHGGRAVDLDPVKAKIVSHPRYHGLLAAFLDCHKARTRASTVLTNHTSRARARDRKRRCMSLVSVYVCSFLSHVFIFLRSAALRRRPRRSRRRRGSARRGSAQPPPATTRAQGRTRSSISSWWSTQQSSHGQGGHE